MTKRTTSVRWPFALLFLILCGITMSCYGASTVKAPILPHADPAIEREFQNVYQAISVVSSTPTTSHNFLSTTHLDTTAGTVVRGDVIVGQGSPATWTRLGIGANNTFLGSNGTDATWTLLTGGGDEVLASTQTNTGPKTFTGTASGNVVPVLINQLGASANALVATSTGTGSFQFNINGRPSGGEQNMIGGVTINGPANSSSFSPALLVLVDSTTNNTNGAGLLEIWEQASAHNSYLLWIHGNSNRNSDEPIRFDGPTYGIDEVSNSTDSTHGRGKWKVISIANGDVDLQIGSDRSWDNSTFKHLLMLHPNNMLDMPGGIILATQDLTNDSAVLTSSDTAATSYITLNSHYVGLTGPLNTTASYWFGLPSTFNNLSQVMIQTDNGRGNNFNVRSLGFTTGGTAGQQLKYNSAAVPTWQNDAKSISSAQIITTAPDYVGEFFYITDGTNAVCVSSGTASGAIVTQASRTVHCT